MIVTTFLFATGKRHAGLFVLATVLSGALLNTLLKLAFARARPDIVTPLTQVSSLSFPSGHAASSAVCYLTLGLMLAQTHTSRLVRIHLIMTAAILTLLVGVSHVFLGVHSSERCAGGLVFWHCLGANLPDAHVIFSAYRKDRAAVLFRLNLSPNACRESRQPKSLNGTASRISVVFCRIMYR